MKKRAQSTLEYLLILAAVVVVFIWAVQEKGPIRTAIDQSFTDSRDALTTAAGKIN